MKIKEMLTLVKHRDLRMPSEEAKTGVRILPKAASADHDQLELHLKAAKEAHLRHLGEKYLRLQWSGVELTEVGIRAEVEGAPADEPVVHAKLRLSGTPLDMNEVEACIDRVFTEFLRLVSSKAAEGDLACLTPVSMKTDA